MISMNNRMNLETPHPKPGILRRAWIGTARSRAMSSASLCGLSVASALLPWVSPIFLAAGLSLAWTRRRFLRSWPMAVPMDAGIRDPNSINPATGKPELGKGVALIGHDHHGRECWMTAEDLKTHMLVLGNTGAGKTEFLLSLCANALSAGSGFIYVDAKGDVSMFAKVTELCARMNRTSDLLVLNFMNGNKHDDLDEERTRVLLRSNTLNPLQKGSAGALVDLLVSLMPETAGDGAMWRGRAVAMLTGVVKALVWMRDHQGLELNAGVMREYMGLSRIISLLDIERYPELPFDIRESVRAYLNSLPGYHPDNGTCQAQTTLDQHGYLEMNFSMILGSLSDVYGHIFNNPLGHIDMDDVVENRRIVLVMLPALEKTHDEIANLGKIILAMLKAMMASRLTSNLATSWEDVVDYRPGHDRFFPYLCVFDEVGHYLVQGMALMTAQARAFGFSMVYASQDITAMKRGNEREAASIIANTNTKIFMRTEEREDTEKLINGIADDRMTVSFRDLKSQQTGEMTVFYKGLLIRTKAFGLLNGGGKRRKLLNRLRLRANTPVPLLSPPEDETHTEEN